MCEMLGTDPVEEDVPLELEDFPVAMQVAFSVYQNLQDNWDSVGGNYLGKVKTNFVETLNILGVEQDNHREIFVLVNLLDSVRAELIKPASK